jgi:hypothetical protein
MASNIDRGWRVIPAKLAGVSTCRGTSLTVDSGNGDHDDSYRWCPCVFFFEQGPVSKDGELPIYSTGGHTTYRKGHQEKENNE